MAKILISLIGGRPVPNILTALHLKPDCLYFVGSKDSWGEGGNHQKAVNALPENLKPLDSYPVEPYKLQDTIDTCRKIIDNYFDDEEIVINSASEPKPMAFGAYDIAKDLRAKGWKIDLCYLSGAGLVWIFKGETERVAIGINMYFTSYGWNVTQKNSNNKLKLLSEIFVGQLPVYQSLLQSIRNGSQGKGKRTIRYKKYLSDEEFELFQKVERLGIVSNLYRDSDGIRWTITTQEDGEILLGGDWLEHYVYQEASSLTDKRKPIFEECSWGVEDKTGKGEIDFVGIRGGQIVIASCKTEDGIKRNWFEELHSKTEQLGKGMCSGLLISTVSKASRKEKELQKYSQWANERRVVLVFGDDIPKIGSILRKIALADKNAQSSEIPFYPRI